MASIILRANNTTESSSKESKLINQLMMLLINDDIDRGDDDCDEVHGGTLHPKNWQTFNLSSLVVVHTC